MAVLRLWIFPHQFITLTYGLPLLLCLWHKDRRLLWSMAGAFVAMSAFKAVFLIPGWSIRDPGDLMLWLMQVANTVVIATVIHLVINLAESLQARNEELIARDEEISRQNEELQQQAETLATQAEELAQQNEELQQQSEEVGGQTEELETQGEELRAINEELGHRETLLQAMLESTRSGPGEQSLLEHICRSLLDLMGGEVVAATIVEQVGDKLVMRCHSGADGFSVPERPAEGTFAALIMEQNRTGFIDDLATRPDLDVLQPPGRPFGSVLASPLSLGSRPIGVVKVYASRPMQWTQEQFRLIEWVAKRSSLVLESIRLREALEQHRRALGIALDAADMGNWQYTLADQICECSDRAQKLYGLSSPRWLHDEDGARAVVHPDDLAGMWHALRAACDPAGDGRYQAEYRVRHPDGWRWLSAWGIVEFEGQGPGRKAVRMIGASRDISDRKQAEDALRLSRERLEWVLSTTGVGLWMNPLPLGVLNWDQRTRDLFFLPPGVTPTVELFWQRLHPDDREPTRLAVDAALRDRTLYAIDHRVVNPATGEVRWIRSAGQASYDEQGRATRFDGVNYDISERKQAEEALKQTTERFALLAETAEALLANPDPQTVVENLCRKVMGRLGCDVFFNYVVDGSGERLRLNAYEGVPGAEAERIHSLDFGAAVCGCVARDRRPLVAEDIRHTTDARTDLVRSYGVQSYCCHPLTAGDRLIGTLSFGARGRPTFTADEVDLMRAVSHQVAIAMERIRSEQSLRDSESFYRQTLESIPGMVFTTRPDGYCDYQSQQWAEYTGVPITDHLGDGWNRLLHPEDRPRAYAAWRSAVEGRAPYDLEYRVRRHDSAYEWFKVIARPIHDADGGIVRWFGVAANIHAIKQAEDQLAAAKAAAESANQAKDHFLAALSHELRTPLTPVLMISQQLESDETLPEHARDDMKTIRRNVQLEARLIDDLLDLTRIARGKLGLKPEAVEVHELLRHALQACCDENFGDRQLRVDWQLAAASSVVLADPARLEQVCWNLLNNAIKFTPPGGTVTLRTGNPSAGRLCIEVSDTGKGIEAEKLTAIFSPFEQGGTETTRRYGGLGLGLAISKALVDMHHGTIRAASDGPGRGATFYVELDTVDGEPALQVVGSEPVGADVGHDGDAPRILLVEDHQPTSMVLQRLMRKWGWEVVSASSVRLGLEQARTRTFDLVVSDLGLPDGTGHELMSRLRDQHGLKGVALSGYGMDQDVQKSLAAGFIAHLVKPINFDELRNAVAAYFAGAGRSSPGSGPAG